MRDKVKDINHKVYDELLYMRDNHENGEIIIHGKKSGCSHEGLKRREGFMKSTNKYSRRGISSTQYSIEK